MTLKKRRVKLAKALRQLTGLSLPRSMAVAKTLSGAGKYMGDHPESQWKTFCECCGPEPVVVTPKGTFLPRELEALANQHGF